MLLLILTCLLLLPVFWGYGRLFQQFGGEIFPGVSGTLLSGMFLISILAVITSWLLPLGTAVEVIVLSTGLMAFFRLKGYRSFFDFFRNNLFVIPAALVVVFFATFAPFILDHYGYYVPTVKWFREAGLVKGIASLDLILGQMSFWHALQAVFSGIGDSYLRLNLPALLIYLIYATEKKSWLHLLFIPLFFPFLQSPAPDLPVIAFALIVLNEILSGNKNVSLIFAFSVWIFAMKPTLLWLPLLALMYAFIIQKQRVSVLWPGVVILGLFLVKNIWTFGFPIFPVQIADLGFSWKPNAEILETSARLATEKTYDMQYRYDEIRNFSFTERIANWFFLSGMKSGVHIAFFVALAAFTFFTFFRKDKMVWLIYTAVMVKVILVLVFSAQYRFFLDVFFVIIFVMFSGLIRKELAWSGFAVLAIITGAFFITPKIVTQYIPTFRLGVAMRGWDRMQLLKPADYRFNKYKTYVIGNLEFNVVYGYLFNYDTALPAISPAFLAEYSEAGIFPQLKGKEIREGFVWRKMTAEEQQYLKEIIRLHEDSIRQ